MAMLYIKEDVRLGRESAHYRICGSGK